MADRPTLVRESWARRVDDALFSSNGTERNPGAASLFYDVRPARLQTAWTQNAAGVWVASARFVVNDVVDDSFTFPVYAPTATASPGGTAQTTRFFVVWRGRWEMLAGAGGEMTGAQILSKLNVTSLHFIRDVTFSTSSNGRYLEINKTMRVAVASIEANDQ